MRTQSFFSTVPQVRVRYNKVCICVCARLCSGEMCIATATTTAPFTCGYSRSGRRSCSCNAAPRARTRGQIFGTSPAPVTFPPAIRRSSLLGILHCQITVSFRVWLYRAQDLHTLTFWYCCFLNQNKSFISVITVGYDFFKCRGVLLC